MMERTQQELQRIKDAVLAERDRLLPADGDSVKIGAIEFHRSSITTQNFAISYKDEHHENHTIWLARAIYPEDARWQLFYAWLGLEARAEREKATNLVADISAAIPTKDTAMMGKLADTETVVYMLGLINGAMTRAIEDYKKGAQQA